jgi:hypothetical protein
MKKTVDQIVEAQRDLETLHSWRQHNAHVICRDMTKGAKAMALAVHYPEPSEPKGGRGKRDATTNMQLSCGFSRELVRQARTVLITIAAVAAMLPSARAGPLTQETMTQYALDQLADVAVANSRCDIEVPEKYFQTLLSLNRQGWTDDADADLAVVVAYGSGTKAYDALSKPAKAAKCKEIADHYSAIDPTPRPPRVADGPECKKLRDRVIEATGAEFRLVSPSGKRVVFEHSLAGEISISCAVPALSSLPAVFIGWEKGAIPPKAWVTLAAMAGQIVTNEPAATLQAGIKKCYQDALKNKSEWSSVELPKSKIECQAFTRNGGGISMSISADDGRDRETPH